MSKLLRAAGMIAVLASVSACQISGAAPPSSQQKSGINNIGAPGSGAP